MHMKKFLFSLLICLSAIPIYAYDVEVDGIFYIIRTDDYEPCAEVTSGDTKYSGSVTIPSTIDYGGVVYPVKRIGNGAFWGCSGLTNIDIPNSVTRIDDWAFNDCTNLTSITIPDSLTTIANGTFAYCSKLISITIPNGVTNIGDQAFRDCI